MKGYMIPGRGPTGPPLGGMGPRVPRDPLPDGMGGDDDDDDEEEDDDEYDDDDDNDDDAERQPPRWCSPLRLILPSNSELRSAAREVVRPVSP